MTQQYRGQSYPPRPPQYQPQPPQYQLPPEEDYDDYDDAPSGRKPWQYFVAGGCVTLILVGCCALTGIVGWVLDAKYGFTTPDETTIEAPAIMDDASGFYTPEAMSPQPLTQPQPQPQTQPAQNVASDNIGIGQPIVAPTTGVELTVFDIQHQVAPNNLAPADNMEFVSVAVQLRQAQPAGVPQTFSFEQFVLRSNADAFYPDPTADNGRRLNAGELSVDGQPVEGDLLFHVPLGVSPLSLVWQPADGSQPITVTLQ